MSTQRQVVIVSAKRTPLGSFLGKFLDIPTPQLGATAIRAAISESRLDVDLIDEVYMGCVLQAGLGMAPARQAALAAGIPVSVPCTTVNKMCGSGMKAVMLAFDAILAQTVNVVTAGGMESMSNAPYLIPRARHGLRMGHKDILDHMFLDGLQNPKDQQLMGCFAENCANKYSFSRKEQDAFAIESVTRSIIASKNGSFKDEIVPVTINHKVNTEVVDHDEQPEKCKIEEVQNLKPAFKSKDGTVTAANSSSISDGAAALVLMENEFAQRLGIKPLARIIAHSTYAQSPEEFTTAPIGAIQNLYKKVNWNKEDVDLFEINEAFAAVAMAAMQELELNHDKVNVHGGACALGHPIGASGARIIVTLVNALRIHGLKTGIASLCIGGGEATAIAIEML